MKYWLAKIKVVAGQYEFVLNYAVAAKKPPSEKRLAKTFYGEGEFAGKIDEHGTGYYFNDGELHVAIPVFHEITKEQYDVIKELSL